MADVKWIKIVTNIFDDEKIRFIETMPNGDEMIVIWLRLLCLCGKSNNGGLLMMTDKIAYTDEMLSSIFNRDIKAIQMALTTFEKLEMIEIINNAIYITNWEKHQALDKMELIKEQTRLRVAKHREQKKLSNVTCNADVTQSNATDIDIEIDKDSDSDNKNKELNKDIDSNKNIESGAKTKRFCKPTLEETENYINENNLNVNARYWYNYYESNGWKVGRNPMKDWKACIRRWNRTEMSDLKNNRKEEQLKITAFDV